VVTGFGGDGPHKGPICKKTVLSRVFTFGV